MFLDASLMASGDYLHAAVTYIAVIYGVPCCDRIRRFKPPICHVLMPRDELVAGTVLAEEMGG